MIQDELTQAQKDLLLLLQTGHGYNPLWSDYTTRVDFSTPIGCLFNNCELPIISTIGGEHLIAYPTLNIPIRLPDDSFATPTGDLLYVDPYFFEKSKLIAFTPQICIATTTLELNTFPADLIPHNPTPYIYNLRCHNFIVCFSNFSYFDRTTSLDLNASSVHDCTLISNTMNVTLSNRIHYTTYATESTLYWNPTIPLIPSIQSHHYSSPPSFKKSLQKLKELESSIHKTLLDYGKSVDLHHLTCIPNAASITTKRILEKLHTSCLSTGTFFSLWKTVPYEPNWNQMNPITWIQPAFRDFIIFRLFLNKFFLYLHASFSLVYLLDLPDQFSAKNIKKDSELSLVPLALCHRNHRVECYGRLYMCTQIR
ncbi:uncharacterized protein LOC118611999 [Rousettus aegyptiacus]|uniref:uncharacterized protein LOC118611999 n=1 Tax=Rousettus aegyptiacus TaxID=9407 RepID=UPI00168D632F|nr:uncharacterized protein LOC118611999 [Rousettus aegyptiacus]